MCQNSNDHKAYIVPQLGYQSGKPIQPQTIKVEIPQPADPYLADDQAPLYMDTRMTSFLASSHTSGIRPSMPIPIICLWLRVPLYERSSRQKKNILQLVQGKFFMEAEHLNQSH